MLGHQLQTADVLLPALPLGTAATSLQQVAHLSPAAAAHHAAKGDAYCYAGTLVVATREPDPVLGATTTTLLYADPRVLQHDSDGVLLALGSVLPALRLTARAGHGSVADRPRGLQWQADVLEREPARRLALRPAPTRVDCTVAPPDSMEEWEYARACIRTSLSYDDRANGPRIDRYLVEDVGFADPSRSSTLVARRHGQLTGHLTWMVRADALDRDRRAHVVDLTVVENGSGMSVAQSLIGVAEQQVARTPGLRMRMTVPVAQATRATALLDDGWTPAFSWHRIDPWIHEGARLLTLR